MLPDRQTIRISEAPSSLLPLGFRSISLQKIPLLPTKQKLLLYNEKYRSLTMEAAGPHKPLSKILF
ncbi:MAG: hypothetical protein ACO1O1_07240 [Adhaeribacter sp.]